MVLNINQTNCMIFRSFRFSRIIYDSLTYTDAKFKLFDISRLLGIGFDIYFDKFTLQQTNYKNSILLWMLTHNCPLNNTYIHTLKRNKAYFAPELHYTMWYKKGAYYNCCIIYNNFQMKLIINAKNFLSLKIYYYKNMTSFYFIRYRFVLPTVQFYYFL